VSAADRRKLEDSELTDNRAEFGPARRIRMYILKQANGTLKLAAPNFDVESRDLDWNDLKDIVEVYQIAKVFTKQTRFTVKPAEERAAVIRKARKTKEAAHV
jgi:hypothetical protein